MKHPSRRLLLAAALAIAAASPASPQSGEAAAPRKPKPVLARALEAGLARMLGEALERSWPERPEWADMAAAILKDEPLDAGAGWFRRAERRHDWRWALDRFDADEDGDIERAELSCDGAAFDRLDRDRDGVLTAGDLGERMGDKRAPELASGGPLAGAAEPLFRRLDRDSNGRLSREEVLDLFVRADREGLGFVTAEELRDALSEPAPLRPKEPSPPAIWMRSPWYWLHMLFSRQLGSFREGPRLGDPAPDFRLPTRDGTAEIALSSSRGKRPVVLIFGSFT
jgi:Ca2+-binding EF-hand superfamily protein